MLEWTEVCCPYCGEAFETALEPMAGDAEFVEDCRVCCQPILFRLRVDPAGGGHRLQVEPENP